VPFGEVVPQVDRSNWLARAKLIQRIVGSLAGVVAALAVASTFLSFTAFGQIRCRAPIYGGGVLHRAPTTSFLYGREGPVCAGDAHSRLAYALIIAALCVAIALAAWLLPTGLPWWMTGEERPVDDTPEWFLRLLWRFGRLPPAGRVAGSESSMPWGPGDADEPVTELAGEEEDEEEEEERQPETVEAATDAVAQTERPAPPPPPWLTGEPQGRRAPMPTPAGYNDRRSRRSRR
jgi:hypothetical protein